MEGKVGKVEDITPELEDKLLKLEDKSRKVEGKWIGASSLVDF
ncbi:hypothetical protein [Neobacillus niacini]|nr:hypothetical protein [Neobacillus niacini]MDR7002217.1 hypothetical protein [Neobacillus niacini]